jgi:hypothetical protein
MILSSFFLLSLLFIGQESQKLCYQRYQDITHREIVGEWKGNHNYQFPGAFEYNGSISNCPLRSSYSCHSSSRGNKVAHQKFFPSNCELPEFQPLNFLHSLRNLRLLFCGDSATLQFFTMLVCSLHGVTPNIEYHLDQKPKYGKVFTSGEEGAIYYPLTNTTLIYSGSHVKSLYNASHGENPFRDYIRFGKLFSPLDIVMLNFGLHFRWQEEFLRMIQNLVEDYNQTLTPFTRPIFLWREISPQHFNSSSPAGIYHFAAKETCVPHRNFTLAYLGDFRNRLAEQWMNKYSIPIMRINNISSTASVDQHFGLNAHRLYDCTHFCEVSGVYYYWRDVLYNIIPLLLKERERNQESKKIPPYHNPYYFSPT